MDENALRTQDGGRGLLIGYATNALKEEKLLQVMQQSSQKLLEIVTPEELQVLSDRAVRQSQLIPQGWHATYCDGDV